MRRALLLLVLLTTALRVARADPPPDEFEKQAIERLHKAIADPDRGVRYAAVQALGKAGADPQWIAAALADSQWCVRQEAAFWLRRAGPAAIPALEQAFEKGDPASRTSTLFGTSSGAAAIPLLKKALADPESSVRVEALASVRRLGRETGAPLVDDVRRLRDGDSPDEKSEAARTLDLLAPPAERAPSPPHPRAGPPMPAPLADALPVNAPGTLPPPRRADAADVNRLQLALAAGSVMQRIRAALALGEAGADAAAIAPGLDDPERDVRLSCAYALGTATGDPVPPLLRALKESNWRVRLAAIESLGLRRAGAEAVAPFLVDPNVAVSNEAAIALRAMGASAAVPTAQQVRTGNYSALEYSPAIFDEAGAGGAAAVPILVPLLEHADVNVRETAARCLRAIGVATPEATKALVRALGDERLCVVAHAALALGRLGLSDDLLATLSDSRARVRAFGAFATGWAIGERRGIDQVPFEVRLPVLDLGAAGPFPTLEEIAELEKKAQFEAKEGRGANEKAQLATMRRRALQSKDPALALPAALALDYEELDARDSERVMELLLPEGFREGAAIDLDRVRETIGSSELAACLAYLALARRTDPSREDIFGQFHRTSRADSLPGIYWFERNADAECFAEHGEILMPEERTIEPLRERARQWLRHDPGSDRQETIRAVLRECLTDVRDGFDTLGLWLLNDWFPTTPDDVRLAIRAAQVIEAPSVTVNGVTYVASHPGSARLAGIRVLGRLTDLASENVLRVIANEGGEEAALLATASLARRGDSEALVRLSERARQDDDALVLFLEAAPRLAAETLADRLVHAESTWDVGLRMGGGWSEAATRLGVRLRADSFAGVEAEVAARVTDPWVLGAIAVSVPGCRTRRVATKMFEVLERPSAAPTARKDDEESKFDEQIGDRIASFLFSADRPRTLAYLRRTANRPFDEQRNWARRVLLRAGDQQSATMLLEWIRSEKPEGVEDEWFERFDGPEALAYLRERAVDAKRDALAALARRAGWPKRIPFDLSEFAEANRDAVRAAVLKGDIDVAKRAHPKADTLADPLGARTPVWRRLALAALAGDAKARGELWSALRAGRLRWIHTTFEDDLQTLGHDPSVLPHWLSDLDSNCCRVSDGMCLGTFEDPYGTPHLYGTEDMGIGEPPSQRALTWFSLVGGRWIPNPVEKGWGYRDPKFMPEPE